jgi:hypothetical protein
VIHLVAHIVGKNLVALTTSEIVPDRMFGVGDAALKGLTATVQVAYVRVKLPATRARAMRDNNHGGLPI